MSSLYRWAYVDITNGHNFGTGDNGTIVLLGEKTSCYPAAVWDNSAPLITPVYLTDGMTLNLATNGSLIINTEVLDTTYIRYVNYTIIEVATGLSVASASLDMLTNETQLCWLNASYDVSGWNTTTFRIYINATDSHNPPKTAAALERADGMVMDVSGDLIGEKTGKSKSIGREGKEIKVQKYKGLSFAPIYTIDFPDYDDKSVKNTVTWSEQNHNFKLLHVVKLNKKGNDYDTYIRVRITAENSLHYFPNSTHYIHLLIDELYFWDADDFKGEGGTILIESITDTTIIMRFTHPTWGQDIMIDGKKVKVSTATIDPLSGTVNSNSESYNITLINSVSSSIDEGGVYTDKEQKVDPIPAIVFGIIIITLIAIAIINSGHSSRRH